VVSFVPDPILSGYKSQRRQGSIQSYTLFIDLSGFTSLTNVLMSKGKEGSEILTDNINALFAGAITAIEDHGGFITGFAGDAITAVFPKRTTTVNEVLAASVKIQLFFQTNGIRHTPFGDFIISVRIGIGIGTVKWRILPEKPQAVYWFIGEGIEEAVTSQHHAKLNTIVFHGALLKEKSFPKDAKFQSLNDDFYQLYFASTDVPTHRTNYRPANSPFVPKSVLNLKSAGEFRTVLACFINLAKIDIRQIQRILNLTHKYGGYFKEVDCTDKGSLIVVLFGAPVALEKTAQRAMEFAIAIRNELLQSVRIGMTSGTAFAGIVGSLKRCTYAALGSTINLSARIMSKANWGEIWCDQSIQTELKNQLQTTTIGSIEFKGFATPVPVFRVEKLAVDKEIVRYNTAMVGREDVLQELFAKCESMTTNRRFGGVSYIYGEAGQGKSRLVFEIARQFESHAQVITLPTDSILNKPLNPFVDWILHTFTSGEIASIETQRVDFRERWAEFAIKIVAVNHEWETKLNHIKSIIAGVVGLEWEGSIFANIAPINRPTIVQFSLKSLLEAYCQLKPALLVLEDLHWLDEESKAVFTALTRHAEAIPFKLIITSRYNDDGSKPLLNLDEEVATDTIDLSALSVEQIADFTANLLEYPIDASLAKYLYARSQGNPFFCEQLVRYLLETDQLKLIDNRYTLAATGIELPTNVQAVLVARIDRLQADLKQVVHTASVLGREFSVQVLAEVLQTLHVNDRKKTDALPQLLAAGEQEYIWNEIQELRYLFSHILLRDAAYEMQLKKQLRKLHQLAADTMVRLYAESAQHWFEIAMHYDRAEV